MKSHFFKQASRALLLLPPLLLALSLASCSSSTTYPQHELAQEILKPRKGHDGKLTNQACLEYDGANCKNWSIKEYDLSNAAIRTELNSFSFICNVAGKRFKICLDSAGFCRVTYECTWLQKIFGGCTKDYQRLPASNYQYLIDANVRCFSEKTYSWDQIK